MKTKRYITVEMPDTSATVDFLGKYGCVVECSLEKNKRGKMEIYVMVKACDDRSTILGEIVAEVPKADDRQ